MSSSPVALVSSAAAILRAALAEVVVGQERPTDELLAAWLAGGHVLLEGVPGVAKTLLARAMAAALGQRFGRIQFTPDLMPADIVGGSVFDFQRRDFVLVRGPVFAEVLLADEINRAPPKTQAALLEAMQERQVTIDGVSHPLGGDFFVVATQNPLEHEGTYPLPEAQLDRFLLEVRMAYPEPDRELEVYRRFVAGRLPATGGEPGVARVVGEGGAAALRRAVASVHVDERVLGWVRELVGATRASPKLACGASPRAGIGLLATARAWAAMEDRDFVIPDDVKRVADPVLRHRLVLTPESELEGLDAGEVLAEILGRLEVPR